MLRQGRVEVHDGPGIPFVDLGFEEVLRPLGERCRIKALGMIQTWDTILSEELIVLEHIQLDM